MDCNRKEALRAMELAEQKMQANDFVTAQKLAKKAQQLYPEIENISRLIAACEVHCSAMSKIGGSEMDWYKILQIEQTADVATIKKQFRKLAFQLHPDKNIFAGAEAAFKLIGEASMTLLDEMKRSLYDRKYRDLTRAATVQKPPQPHKNGKSSVQNQYVGAPKNPPGPNPVSYTQSPTFWTHCPFCKVRYQYHIVCLRATLVCQGCSKYFVAEDIGTQSASDIFSNQKGTQKPVPPKAPSQVKKGSSSRKKSSKKSTGGPQATPDERNADKSPGDSKVEKRENGDVGAKKKGTETPKPATVKPGKVEPSKSSSKKRVRKIVVESSESESETESDKDVGDGVEENNVGSSKLDEHKRRSSRQKHNVSYKEKLSDDDGDFVNPPKRSRVSKSASSAEEEISTETAKGSFSACRTEELKKNTYTFVEADMSNHQNGHRQKSTTDDSSKLRSEEASSPEMFQSPDPEFSDFDKDKAESCFAADQIWAMYDPEDGMPRFYACIKKVCLPGFKLNITWLEASPEKRAGADWCNAELPVACGKYKLGGAEVAEREMFSHQMYCTKNGRSMYINPRKGETWAIFQNWDINWSSDPEKHKPFKFDFVEVMSDFDKAGAGVTFLGKVKGFVSLFQRTEQNGVLAFHISADDQYRFSHRIPSFQMTGNERKGVPKGSYEFDPAAIPQSFFELCDGDDAKTDDNDSNVAGGSAKHEIENSKRVSPKSSRSPRKPDTNDQIGRSKEVDCSVKKDKHRGNLTPLKRSAVVSQTDEKMATPKKQENCLEADAFKPRRSPRDLSKKISEVNGSQCVKTEQTQPDKVENLSPSNGTDSGKEKIPKSPVSGKKTQSVKVEKSGPSNSTVSERGKQECPKSPQSVKLPQVESFDFSQLTTEDKFNRGQIWALCTNNDMFPKSYGHVKKVEFSPEFQVYLGLLELVSPSNKSTHQVSCGTFKVNHRKAKPFPLSAFSHCLNDSPVYEKEYTIYPCKGEIWALHKNRNINSACDVVEVLDDDDRVTKVIVLSRVSGLKSIFRASRSKSSVVEVPRAEVGRFSHQIRAIQQKEGDSRLVGNWEVDSKFTPTSGVICID